jgi:hypothetical protein
MMMPFIGKIADAGVVVATVGFVVGVVTAAVDVVTGLVVVVVVEAHVEMLYTNMSLLAITLLSLKLAQFFN